jgi:hypothetical protein
MQFWGRNFLFHVICLSLADCTAKGLVLFLYSPVETLPILQNASSGLVVVWKRRGMSSQLNLEKVRRESGGDEPFSDQKILPVSGTKMAGVWIGRGLSGSAYADYQ